MKLKFNFIALLLLLAILSLGKTVAAQEKTKEYHESWAANSVESLEVINKFGEVKVKNEGGSEITIDVIITVEAASEKRADELLSELNVTFRKSGNTLKAETTVGSDFKSQRRFSIDYEVNIPNTKNLNITNKYGNTFVNALHANGNFNIQYGNLTANELRAPANGDINISLAYGKSSIGLANDLVIGLKYSNMTLGEIKNLKLESKYSSLDIEECNTVRIMSKYDKFNFEKVNSITATTKYSHINIEELSTGLEIEAGYGGIRVDQIKPDFEFISITNSYGQISLGLKNANYSIDASCEYCGISYPEDIFKGDRMKERNTTKITGKIGEGNGGEVRIISRYGEIKLRD